VTADRRPSTDAAPFRQAEDAYIQHLMSDGVVEHFFLRADRSGGYFVVATEGLDAARSALEALPMHTAGLLSLSFEELAP
jgi:hypothetical protein